MSTIYKVLMSMEQKGLDTGVYPAGNITKLNQSKKRGCEVTFSCPDMTVDDFYHGKFVTCLVVANSEQYKAELKCLEESEKAEDQG